MVSSEDLATILAIAVVLIYATKLVLVAGTYREQGKGADLHDYLVSIVLFGAAVAMLAAVEGFPVSVLTAIGLPVMLTAGVWFVWYWVRR
jgi:hypothetical protein